MKNHSDKLYNKSTNLNLNKYNHSTVNKIKHSKKHYKNLTKKYYLINYSLLWLVTKPPPNTSNKESTNVFNKLSSTKDKLSSKIKMFK